MERLKNITREEANELIFLSPEELASYIEANQNIYGIDNQKYYSFEDQNSQERFLVTWIHSAEQPTFKVTVLSPKDVLQQDTLLFSEKAFFITNHLHDPIYRSVFEVFYQPDGLLAIDLILQSKSRPRGFRYFVQY
ncbi:hypothetical protein FVR03_12230 [Pontibacter qinzhouensis]|uniref:Uncharacterized protein n=1 Tax=Pontibacter qinzhouensis TaxID=2603253 RepID=A0A5C8K9E4_9BACT|nr:hypothetical protein [Pontibacter qinzhouensis]TXK45709.1 hypothetical protein FVR03_12230 [Pontibacter qinzhouensis]